MSDKKLEDLRLKIAQIDEHLLETIAKRMACSLEIAKQKAQLGRPIKDFNVEKKVFERAITKADSLLLDHDFTEKIYQILIEHSVYLQDNAKKSPSIPTKDLSKKCVVVGGGGQMGQWFAQFFTSSGFDVQIYDPQFKEKEKFNIVTNFSRAIASNELIVLATPLSKTAEILEQIIELSPKGLILEISSLKSQFKALFKRAKSAGIRIGSIHPMFGPNVKTLSGRNILIVEDESLCKAMEIEELFLECSAQLIRMALDDHDKIMGFVLGASHLLNILFATVIRKSGFSYASLLEASGTTFRNQMKVTGDVANENMNLYYSIQTMNQETQNIFALFESSLSEFKKYFKSFDEKNFLIEVAKNSRYVSKET